MINNPYIATIASELKIRPSQVEATLRLLKDGSTIPFIARYRKEATDSLDEVALTQIRDRLHQLAELDQRRETVLKSIQEQGKLTEELKAKILAVQTINVLEDIYLPYKPKRRTRATVAKEKGLEPLAEMLFAQNGVDPEKEAVAFVNPEKQVNSTDEALAGARDIMAEWINENAQARDKLRKLFAEEGIIQSRVIKGKELEGSKFRDYFEWQELAKTAPSHRILAVRRGEKESVLLVRILPPQEDSIRLLKEMFLKAKGEDSEQVALAIEDSFKRLLSLSLENEFRLELKKKADKEAIEVFKNNLRELLMASPMGEKNVLAIDPGLRTGCKVVCLDKQGKLLHHDAIFLVQSDAEKEKGARVVKELCNQYSIEVIAIGNGTASRETEQFIRSLGLPKEIVVVMVSESGASIYSASEVARDEFPDYDVTVRGAVSIGRRLMDPLAELVKIDPKSIGVGQYQHDVDQNFLKNSLDDVVISCVNQVGVELNTASKQLLTYVSGIGPARAEAIIQYRNKHGRFRSREDLHSIDGLGQKAFEQSAGFLRIHGADNPLDASAVHPESYNIVDAMAQSLGVTIKDLITNDNIRKKIDLKQFVSEKVGLPTLKDIANELAKPGRDPRPPFQLFSYKEGVVHLEDLKVGMKLPGVITNVTAFGAFVDIGVHQDGLIHISQLSNKFVKDPHEVVKVHQKVMVTVLEVDLERKRIALSAKN
jgi:uncharacterized protein